jgi:restriction system protein
MHPLLELCKDNQEHTTREAASHIAEALGLKPEQLSETLPSGQQAVFDNRLGWARTYLAKARLIEKTGRGRFKITARGQEFLKSAPKIITAKDLERFDEFLEFRQKPRAEDAQETLANNISEMADEELTPEESLEVGYQKLRRALASEILERVKACTPLFFERLVVELLLKMGYGGSRKDAGEAIGRSGDGGIDGIIKEDRLGLDSVYIQAKRWGDTVVGRPEIQKFAGALQGHRARKGIFITTSRFSGDARDFVKMIESKIVLIDGEQLAQLMIDFSVGVAADKIYEIKKIDSDYFVEE